SSAAALSSASRSRAKISSAYSFMSITLLSMHVIANRNLALVRRHDRRTLNRLTPWPASTRRGGDDVAAAHLFLGFREGPIGRQHLALPSSSPGRPPDGLPPAAPCTHPAQRGIDTEPAIFDAVFPERGLLPSDQTVKGLRSPEVVDHRVDPASPIGPDHHRGLGDHS